MKYIVEINGKSYEVEVEKGEATLLKTTILPALQVEQKTVAVQTPAAPAQAPVLYQATVGNGEPVKSPMPGTVVDIKISAGKSVKKGEPLLILEAMKMENEIVAPKDGVIASVIVAKGASVSTGEVLLVMQ